MLPPLVKGNGKHLLDFAPETNGNGLSVSSFHTIKASASEAARSWQRPERRCLCLWAEGAEARKSLSKDESNASTFRFCCLQFLLSVTAVR